MTKPYGIPKLLVWEAYQCVKANGGSAGFDSESSEQFESNLSSNLYKLWNRMCSGSYFPPPVMTNVSGSVDLNCFLIQRGVEYCKDINRQGDLPCVQFTFLGYTFSPRKAVDKYGRVYVNFASAVSRDALKAMRQTIRGWHLQLKCDKSLADLSAMFNPVLRGWHQYYGRFYGSAMSVVWKHMNDYLTRWLRRKYKQLARHKTRAGHALGRLARKFPGAFWHWKLGCLPKAG